MAVERLLPEIWAHICQYLDWASLRSLSLVDHRLRALAVVSLFSTVTIQPLRAAQFEQFLWQTAYSKHIRVLEVCESLPPTNKHDDIFDCPEEVYGYFADYQPPRPARIQDQSYQPVAALLKAIPALKDLIWTSPRQFPPCLLRVLHDTQQLSACRLHLRTFRLRGLAEKSIATDPYELELVRSSNLYSIWFYYHDEDVSNNEYRLPEAVSYVTRSLAPHLRVVRLRQEIIQMTPVQSLNIDDLRKFKQHRRLQDAVLGSEHCLGRLEQLQFAGVGPELTAKEILGWSECTDFRCLRELILDRRVDNESLTALTKCHFMELAALSLRLDIEPGMMSLPEHRQPDSNSRPARAFLCSLPPLRKLRIVGEIDHSCLQDVLAHHGRRLRTLQLLAEGYSPHRLSLLPAEAQRLAQSCQALKDLTIQMLRSGGDADEVAAYSSLGSIPSLQTLDLTLDASDYAALRNDEELDGCGTGSPYSPRPAPGKAHFDDFDMEFGGFTDCGGDIDPLKGHFKEMLINAALDRNLVESIYAKLTEAKAHQPRAFPFDRVSICSLGGGDFGMSRIPVEIDTMFKEIQSKWLIQPASTGHKVAIAKLGSSSDSSGGLLGSYRDRDLDPRLEPVFRRIWPARTCGSNWQCDWYGLPLAS